MPKFGAAINTQRIPILGLIPEQAATGSPPAAPVEGLFWNDSTLKVIKVYLNGGWVTLGAAGAGGPPSGAAGGSLTGNYPNPTILAGAVGGTEIASAIKDAAAGTASLRTLGTGAVQAASGADARFTDSRAPNGSAGGDLTGSSYPNPVIANLAVTNAKIADLTITDTKVATANKDGIATTPSLRTLGTGAQQAAAGTDPRFSDTRAPSGTAGGSLAGNYPNPTLKAGVVTDTEVAAANKDGVAGTPSLRTLGAGAQQAASGTDARFSDSRAPSGTAGGSLAGIYPNPTIKALVVTDAEVAVANKDGAAGTVSLRTLGYTGNAAMPGVARLDQIAIPTADLNLNSRKITGLLDPTQPQEAATKAYVDATAQGLNVKDSVRVATTAPVGSYNPTGGTGGIGQMTAMPTTLDTISLAAGDRILYKDCGVPAGNGIYVVTTLGSGANGVWDRAPDFNTAAEAKAGSFTFVTDGSPQQADTGWVVTSPTNATIGGAGGPAITWAQFSGGGSITAGTGMTKTGNSLDVIGTASRIVANADSIDIDAAYAGQTSITTVGTIATGNWNGTDIPVIAGGTGASDSNTAMINLQGAKAVAGTVPALTAGVWTTLTTAIDPTNGVVTQFQELAPPYQEIILDVRQELGGGNNLQVKADVTYGANTLRFQAMAKAF